MGCAPSKVCQRSSQQKCFGGRPSGRGARPTWRVLIRAGRRLVTWAGRLWADGDAEFHRKIKRNWDNPNEGSLCLLDNLDIDGCSLHILMASS